MTTTPIDLRKDLPKSDASLDLSANDNVQKARHAPSRDQMLPFSAFGLTPAEGAFELAADNEALAAAYGKPSFHALTQNGLVLGCALAACIGGLLFGFDQGLVSIILVLPKFLERFTEIDPAVSSSAGFMKGLLTALLELGALIGALCAGFIADRFSRKMAIFVGVIVFLVGSTIQTASFNYGTLVAGRTIGGFGIGVLSTVAPTYIAETAPPNLRGTFLVAEDIAIVFGIVVMYYITYGTREMASEACYRLPFALQTVPAFLLAGLLLWMPHSPRWLASVGRDEEALDALCRLRKRTRDDALVQAEWLSIRSEACYVRECVLENHPSIQGEGFLPALKLELASWSDCFRSGVARRTWISIGLMFFQQFVGINALIYYSPTLFNTLGFDAEMQFILSGILNILQLIAVCSALFTLDSIGRRPPLLASSIGMTVCHVIVAIMIGLFAHDWDSYPNQARAGTAFLMLFMIAYGIGWGPVPWSIPSEIHSTSSRAKGVALSVATNWLGNFIVGLITPPLIEASAWGTFVFFAGFSFLSFFFGYFLVPETSGLALEDMDQLFHSNSAARDSQEKALILGQLTGKDTTRALFDRHLDKRENRGTERRFEYA